MFLASGLALTQEQTAVDDPHEEVEIKPQLKPTPVVAQWEGRLAPPNLVKARLHPGVPMGIAPSQECPCRGGHQEEGERGNRSGSLSPWIWGVLLPGAVTLGGWPAPTVPRPHLQR